MKILVKFDKNWADEFDVQGFKIYDTRQEWDDVSEDLDQLSWEFGTNEGWEEGEFDDMDFSVSEISDQDAEVLTRLFGSEWGHFPL